MTCATCGKTITGPYLTCSDCGMAQWRANKQKRIDDLLRERDELRERMRKVERELERERYWGD